MFGNLSIVCALHHLLHGRGRGILRQRDRVPELVDLAQLGYGALLRADSANATSIA